MSGYSNGAYVPYNARPGWTDLHPVPQPDAPNCLVPIAYTEEYRDAMDTFRALVQLDELSDRTLEVTSQIIRMNPGHYSIWARRAQTLLALGKDLNKELDLMDELVREHIKSYQVWQHRRTIVLALDSPNRELPFTARALTFDAKNYHTWAYRQWVLCHFFASGANSNLSQKQSDERRQVWTDELAYTAKLLEEDVRNNSAWNHRFFVAFESGQDVDQDRGDQVVRDREIAFTKQQLALSPNNPSAWAYSRGILARTKTPLSTPSLLSYITPLALGARSGTSSDPQEPVVSEHAELPCALAVEYLADAAAQQAKEQVTDQTDASRAEKKDEAVALYKSLCQVDPIRSNYWLYRAKQVEVM